MATHTSVLAWRIPRMGEPGGLPSLPSQSQTRLKRLSSSSSKDMFLIYEDLSYYLVYLTLYSDYKV